MPRLSFLPATATSLTFTLWLPGSSSLKL